MVPKWVAVLLRFGAIVYPVGHIGESELVTHLAEFVLLVPMVWIGLRHLTRAKPSHITVPATA